jgi:hypothetical protein
MMYNINTHIIVIIFEFAQNSNEIRLGTRCYYYIWQEV